MHDEAQEDDDGGWPAGTDQGRHTPELSIAKETSDRSDLYMATARLLAASGPSPGRRLLIALVERDFDGFSAFASVSGGTESEHIAAWVVCLWRRGCTTNTIAAYLSALSHVLAARGRPAGQIAFARHVLAGMKRRYPRRPNHAGRLTEAQILAVVDAAMPGRGNSLPATAVLSWRLRAPLCQLREATEEAFGPDDAWVDIVLPEAGSTRVGRFERRVVRLDAIPGDLCCPVYAARALRRTYPEGPLLRRLEVRSMYPLARQNPSSPAWGDDLDEEEFRSLVLHLSRERLIAARDRVLICCAYEAALRIGEVVGLLIEDIEERPWGLLLRLRKSKTNQAGRSEFVRLARRGGPLCAVGAIEAWLRLVPWRSGALVPGLAGGDSRRPELGPSAMETQSALRRLRVLVERAGIEVHVGAHTLRRSGAARIYERTGDVAKVAQALRHTSPATTLRYLEDSDADDAGDADSDADSEGDADPSEPTP